MILNKSGFAKLTVLCAVLLAGAVSSSASTSIPTLSQIKSEIAKSAAAAKMPDLNKTIPQITDTNWADTQLTPTNRNCYVSTDVSTIPTNPTKSCSYGDRSASRTILLLGDSHAGMFGPALDVLGKQLKWRLVLLAHAGCPPWIDPYNVDYWGHSLVACNTWRTSAIKYANRLHPAVILPIGRPGFYGMNHWPTAAEIAKKAEALFNALKPSHARITLIGQTPYYPFAPNQCLVSVSDPRQCERAPKDVLTPTLGVGLAMAAKAGNVKLVNVLPLFCTAKLCPLFVEAPGGVHLIYWDTDHFFRFYTAWIAKGLEQLLAPTLPK